MADDGSKEPNPHDTGPPDDVAGQPTETAAPDPPGKIPPRIGHFHVKRVIASGGMGTVYEAVQDKPRRTVALKVMKHGIASRSALRRFEYESQILARLYHPGIAQVYEAGTHDDGNGPVPYFAMEYIPNARSITDFARKKKLKTHERLELFAKVCDAVHHGHQKGVIHRDLKPGNILVDSAGKVKIIDFGVARGTDSDLAVTTLQTDVGQLIGTLQYMSPEQCEADPHDIDTRSDVYALGVVLYELLAGKLPYDVRQKPVYESTRVIREQTPTRLSTVDRTLRGDIETIAFKALEKDRERRYQSATELAQDIRRYLTGEAIVARPPSIVYQLHVFARRNKALFGAAAAVFVVLLAGVIVSTLLYFRADAAYRETLHARQVAEAQRDRALAADRRTTAINEYFKELIGAADPFQEGPMRTKSPATEMTVAELLEIAGRQIDQRFADQPELEAEVRCTLSDAFFGLGRYEDAESQARSALELQKNVPDEDHPQKLEAMRRLAGALAFQGQINEAVGLVRQVRQGLQRTLGRDHPDAFVVSQNLAWVLIFQGKYQEAEALVREVIAELEQQGDEREAQPAWPRITLAVVLANQGRLEEGERYARQALEIANRQSESDPHDALFAKLQLAWVLDLRGKCDEAEMYLQESLDEYLERFGRDHPLIPHIMSGRAVILLNQGKLTEAEALARELWEEQCRTLGRDSKLTLQTVGILVEALNAQGKYTEAEPFAREALDATRRREDSDSPGILHDMDHLAVALRGLGQTRQAEELARTAVSTTVRTYTGGFHMLPTFRAHWGQCLADLKRYAEAEEQFLAAYEGELAMRGQRHASTREVVANLVQLYEAWNKLEEAAKWRAKLPTSQPASGAAGQTP